MRKVLIDMLGTLGARYIVEAGNGQQALKEMAGERFDIVLCNYTLGKGKNGLQVLEEARQRRLLPITSIFIIVSDEQTSGMVLGAMETKPDEYLAKPFNALQLSVRLQKNLKRKDYLYPIERELDRDNVFMAIKQCDKLLSQNDRNTRTRLLKIRGELALKVGDLNKAEQIYREVLVQRDLPWARLGLGIIAYRQNDLERAIVIFEQLVVQNPLFLDGYDWLSQACQADEQPIKAQDVLMQAVELSPTALRRQKNLARVADYNERLDVAEQAYKAVVRLSKYSVNKSSGDFAGLARFYLRTDAVRQALTTLDDMRREYVNNPEAELRAATLETELYRHLGEDKKSKVAFAKARSLSRSLGLDIPKDLQLDFAKACMLNEDDATADAILESLIVKHVEDDGFMEDIRRMLVGIGRGNHSEKLMQKARQELVEINNKGVALYKQGNIGEAMRLLEQAASKMPENKIIAINLIRIALCDLKLSGPNEERILRAHGLIKRARHIGLAEDKLGELQMEFAKLTQTSPKGGNDVA